jgi:hypothetical protein
LYGYCKRERGIMMKVVNLAVAGALALGAVAAGPATQAAAASAAKYEVCVPASCLPPTNASVQGIVDWSANTNTFQATNTAYSTVSVTFTEYEAGVATGTVTLQVPRGRTSTGVSSLDPATDSLGIVLCPPIIIGPSCPSTIVKR